MFETLRRLVSDCYNTKDAGMSAGLPRVNADASQLKHLLDHYDAQLERIRTLEAGIEREVAYCEHMAKAVVLHGIDTPHQHRERAARLWALLNPTK